MWLITVYQEGKDLLKSGTVNFTLVHDHDKYVYLISNVI